MIRELRHANFVTDLITKARMIHTCLKPNGNPVREVDNELSHIIEEGLCPAMKQKADKEVNYP